MRRVGGALLFGLALTAGTLIARPVGATPPPPSTPTCYDYRTSQELTATKWLTEPGTLKGTSGDDVLVGSTGIDVIDGKGGNDVICSAPFSAGDLTNSDTIKGGSGDDDIYGSGVLDGGSGNDFVLASGPNSIAKGGSGADIVEADNGADADGGSGDDNVYSGSGGADQLLGGSGRDQVFNSATANAIDCGPNVDKVDANGAVSVKRCEGSILPP